MRHHSNTFQRLFIAAFFVVAVQAGYAQSSAGLKSRLEAVLHSVKGATQVGLCVVDAKTGERVFAADEKTLLKPASVLKLFTTSAALLRFGPDFHYETRLFAYDGELWVIGSGDPALGDERLCKRSKLPRDFLLGEWTEAARRAAGGRPYAKIALDDSIFDQEWRHPSWPADQNMAWYQAPVGALNYNDNCLDSRAVVSGERIALTLTPPLPASFVQNSLRIGSQNRPIVRRDADSDIFEFSGVVQRGGEMQPVAINRPTVFFGHMLRQMLESSGQGSDIAVARRTIPPAAWKDATPVATHRTALRDAVWRANTFSQNLFAECMLKTLEAYEPGGRRSGRAGSFAGGVATLRETLSRAGVDLGGATIVDGSGLSHENQITAEQITSLLLVMSRSRHADVFRESLADAGQDGTMKNRFKDPVFAGRLAAKTGTIQNVHTLAGYFSRNDGRTLVFAVLVNGPGGTDLPVRIAKALAD